MKPNYPWDDPYNRALLFSPSLAPQAVRKRLLIYKKFTQFYFYKFQPITQEQQSLRKQHHRLFRFSTTAGPLLILVFLVSLRHRKDQLHAMHQYQRPNLIHSLVVDVLGSLVVGYSAFSLFSYKFIFERTGSVREKLQCEARVQFDRMEFFKSQQLVKEEDYPLKKQLKGSGGRRLWDEIKPEEEARITQKYQEMIKKSKK